MVPKDFRKPLCIAAGCITLVEAVLWEIASIYSLGVYNCVWKFFKLENSTVSTWNMFYISYFMGGCNSPVDAATLGFNFLPPSSAAHNLQIWIWISTLATILWIPACGLLIVAAVNEVRGRAGAVLYYPWICLTVLLIILDLAATIYHLVDISSTNTADDYAKFIGSKDWNTLTNSASSADIVTWLPSLFVSLYFCRFLVFWLLNVFFVFNVYKASSAVSLYKTKHLQPGTVSEEKGKSWKKRFYQGPDPAEYDNKEMLFTRRPHLDKSLDVRQHEEMREVQRPKSERRPSVESESLARPTTHSPKYRVDEFGIPIEELNNSEPREISHNQNEGHLPRTPFQPGRVFDYTGRPLSKPESGWRQDDAPPMASGAVKVPAGLNRNQPFSYFAGDQPQLLKNPVSRSNSKAKEYPVIPHPDYTVADRRKYSLEYVPNRFKVPSTNQPLSRENSFKYDSTSMTSRSPTSPRRAGPVLPKKPQSYVNVRVPHRPQLNEVDEDSTAPQSTKYLNKQAASRQEGY